VECFDHDASVFDCPYPSIITRSRAGTGVRHPPLLLPVYTEAGRKSMTGFLRSCETLSSHGIV
jgi:hypothetical protein